MQRFKGKAEKMAPEGQGPGLQGSKWQELIVGLSVYGAFMAGNQILSFLVCVSLACDEHMDEFTVQGENRSRERIWLAYHVHKPARDGMWRQGNLTDSSTKTTHSEGE